MTDVMFVLLYSNIKEEKATMISKNIIKQVKALELKKNRQKEGLFVAEGQKVVGDLTAIAPPQRLIATEEWYMASGNTPRMQDAVVTEDELRKVSFLQHPQQVIGLFAIPKPQTAADVCTKELCLALDKVQDPGNLGTIIRIADWFGIGTIFCGTGTVDAFSPKVVQATMGSIAHVNIVNADLQELISGLPTDTHVYGTSLNGQDIYSQELTPTGLIVMGNEGNGISPEVMRLVNRTLFIPCYSSERKADSLNVAVATAVTCAEFRRQAAYKSSTV